nr:transducin (beta) 3-like protein [Cryptomonas curvata]
MPEIIKNKFSIQTNRSYRILSEFINILDNCCLISIRNLFSHKGYLVIATVFLNRIYIFIKNKQKIILINSFEEQNYSFKSICISKTGSKVIANTIDKIVIYGLNSNCIHPNEIFYKNQKFFKIFDHFDKKETSYNISSIYLNKEETSLTISYINGRIRIFDLFKKNFLDLNLNIIFEKFFMPLNCFFSSTIIGKTTSNFFIEYNISKKKTNFIKQTNFFLVEHNYIILQIENSIEIRCSCHNKTIINIALSILCQNIIFLTQNKLLIEKDSKFFLLLIGPQLIKNCLIDFHLNQKIKDKKENIQKIFVSNNNCTNFTLTLITEINNIIFLKPISEGHEILLIHSPQIFNHGEVHAIRFIGPKNSIIIATNNSYINLYDGKSFLFKGFYYFKNSVFLNLEIKGNMLVANNTSGKIIFWKIDTYEIISWINLSNKYTNVFSLFKKMENEGFLITGSKDCAVKFWKIFFIGKCKLKIRLINTVKIEGNSICLISTHKDGNIFATASHEKKILLWKTTLNDPFLELEKFKKSIWSLNFSTIETILATGTSDGFIYFFNFLNGYCLKKIAGHESPVTNCLFTADGSHFYTSDSRGKIKIWKLNTETCTNVIAKQKGCIWALGINQDNTIIVSGCSNGTIVIIKEISSDLFLNRKKSLNTFLNLQKISSRMFSVKNNYLALKIIFIQKDPDLLYDFLKFLFNRLSYNFDYLFNFFINDLDINQLKFLLRSIITWNLEKKKLYFSQHLLKIVILSKKAYFLKNINNRILNSLLLTTKNVQKLIYNYKQIIN